MNEKTQRFASGIAIGIATLIVILNLFSVLSLLGSGTAKVSSTFYASYGIHIIALIAAAVLFFMGQKKGFGIGSIAIAIYFIYACFSSFIAVTGNPTVYNFSGTSETSCRTMGMVFSILRSGLFAVAGGLLFAGWQKGDGKNSLKTIGGVLGIIGAVCGIISAALLSTIISAVGDIAIGAALFIISLPPAGAAASQSQTAFASTYSSQASQTPSAAQLAELKQLLDAGVITQEDFDNQKKLFMGK